MNFVESVRFGALCPNPYVPAARYVNAPGRNDQTLDRTSRSGRESRAGVLANGTLALFALKMQANQYHIVRALDPHCSADSNSGHETAGRPARVWAGRGHIRSLPAFRHWQIRPAVMPSDGPAVCIHCPHRCEELGLTQDGPHGGGAEMSLLSVRLTRRPIIASPALRERKRDWTRPAGPAGGNGQQRHPPLPGFFYWPSST